jgi:hypothetical protein
MHLEQRSDALLLWMLQMQHLQEMKQLQTQQ